MNMCMLSEPEPKQRAPALWLLGPSHRQRILDVEVEAAKLHAGRFASSTHRRLLVTVSQNR